MGVVVFVAGCAGTGKSTLADVLAARLNGVHLDFDDVSAGVVGEARTAHPQLTEAQLLEQVKDARYQALHEAVSESGGGPTPIVVSAPFTSAAATADSWARWVEDCPRWVLVWLDLDEGERARRVLARGAERDHGARPGAPTRPGVPHLALDASQPPEQLAEAVLQAIRSSPGV